MFLFIKLFKQVINEFNILAIKNKLYILIILNFLKNLKKLKIFIKLFT